MLQIHAGLHKTGSTAIQVSLKEKGILLQPRFGGDVETIDRALLEQAIEGQKILSSEAIFGSHRNLYRIAPQRIASLFESGIPMKLIVFFRPPISWHQSLYIQQVQEGEALSPTNYLETMSTERFFKLSRLVELLERAPQHVEVVARCYSQPVHQFSEFVGIELTDFEANASMNPVRAIVASEMNADEELRPYVRRILQRQIPSSAKPNKNVFSLSDSKLLRPAVKDWEKMLASTKIGRQILASGSCDDISVSRASQITKDDLREELAEIVRQMTLLWGPLAKKAPTPLPR